MGSSLEKWREVWERKGSGAFSKSLSLHDLIAIDGFDKSIGAASEDAWLKIVRVAEESLGLSSVDYLLEVGCGAGAMLLPLSKYVRKVAGVDYSASLIEIIKNVIPQIEAKVSEANNLPFPDKTFDKIIANSVFQYFPDKIYAENAIKEMQRTLKSGGKIMIMDIPDISKKTVSISTREKFINYNQADYTHLYYEKEFFEGVGNRCNLFCKIFNQEIEGYENSPFRFNVLYLDNKKY